MKAFELAAYPAVVAVYVCSHLFIRNSMARASLSAALISSGFIIFVLPLLLGQGVSNIWPIAFVFWFVIALAFATLTGLLFRAIRGRSNNAE